MNVKELREALGLSEAELAQRAGLDQHHIASLEDQAGHLLRSSSFPMQMIDAAEDERRYAFCHAPLCIGLPYEIVR